MRKSAAFFLFACLSAGIFAQQYRIDNVIYEITGLTQEYALKLAVPIDTTYIFKSLDELNDYLAFIGNELNSQRVFVRAEVQAEFLAESGGITPVSLTVITIDTHNFIVVPYFKYDSNYGWQIKLKLQNSNPSGLMKPLAADFTFRIGNGGENGIGLDFEYTLPFHASIFDIEWINSLGGTYVFGDSKPEFSTSSGLQATVPFDYASLIFTFKQSAAMDPDYRIFGDEFYATEYAEMKVPVKILRIRKWIDLFFTPDIHFEYNWNKDGINPENLDLISPLVGIGYSFSSSHINWIGNYRRGFLVSVGPNFDFNFNRAELIPSVSSIVTTYSAFKYAGLQTRSQFFAITGGGRSQEIGEFLRGIRDEPNGVKLKTSHAILFNIDVPIKLFQTNWRAAFGKKKETPAFFRYFDFEMQFSPFLDIAFTRNDSTGRTFSYLDGFYAGGFEILVYPTEMRSIQGRISVGFDLGRSLFANKIDTSWRDSGSKYELLIGIGLHY